MKPRLGADTADVENTADLRVLLASRHPLLFVESDEEERLLDIIERAGDAPLWTWSSTKGLSRRGEEAQYRTTDLIAALDFISELAAPGVFVLADAGPALGDPRTRRRLKEVALAARDSQTILVTGAGATIPEGLADVAHAWALRPPSRQELSDLAMRTLGDFHARGVPIRITRGELRQLADSLSGMTLRAAERIIQRAVVEDGQFDARDLAGVRAAKAGILNEDGVLEVIETRQESLSDVGGLDDLKKWLRLREPVFKGETAGLDLPKGILLTGVPGCGKSLVAKTIASTWGVPLVLLDPSRLYSKYVGESEQRLDAALRTVEAMSPAVVWIDEIEKGFSSGGSDGGVSKRVLGTFLRWLQDREANVFAVATANDVSSLPPELLRRGRFDQIFFVDLPDRDAREAIFRSHLERREQEVADLDLPTLVDATDGFSGAEIETAIVGAMYRTVATGERLDTESLHSEIRDTVPLSVSRAEDIAALRSWASDRALAA